MFYRLASMWNEPFSLAAIQTGVSGGNARFQPSYPVHLRDQILQLEVSADLKTWTKVADNSRPVYPESFTPSVQLTCIETNQEVQVTITHDLSASGPYTPANLLANGGFESRSTLGGTTFGTASSTVAHSDTHFLQLSASGGSVSVAYQTVPASAGEEFNLSGTMYTATALPADGTFGLFKSVFEDPFGNQRLPASVSIGQLQSHPGYPGAESLPMLDSTSPVGSWVFSEVQAVAPPDTASVSFFVIHVAQSANTMYFDSIEATEADQGPTISNTAYFRLINDGR